MHIAKQFNKIHFLHCAKYNGVGVKAMYGERIREQRKLRGWTMKQLGQRLDVAESTISGYENEIRRPDLDALMKFAELFDVSVDYLIGRSDSPRPRSDAADRMRESPASYNAAILDGRVEPLTEDEAQHLKNSLEMFRLWKASRRE